MDSTVIEFMDMVKQFHLKESKENARLWDIRDLALYFKVSTTTIDRMRKTIPDFPTHLVIGKSHRWSQEVVKNWAKRQAA